MMAMTLFHVGPPLAAAYAAAFAGCRLSVFDVSSFLIHSAFVFVFSITNNFYLHRSGCFKNKTMQTGIIRSEFILDEL